MVDSAGAWGSAGETEISMGSSLMRGVEAGAVAIAAFLGGMM